MLKTTKDSYFAYSVIAALMSAFGLVLVLLPLVWPGLTLDVLVQRSAWGLAVLAIVLLVGMALLALRHMLSPRDPAARGPREHEVMGR